MMYIIVKFYNFYRKYYENCEKGGEIWYKY